MNKEFGFLIKIIRNAFILAGLMFVSVFATGSLSYELVKPVLVFFLGYIFAELARHYGIKTPTNKSGSTMIFA